MIDLYAHNRAACESAASMLHESGRTAVVHPTGTDRGNTYSQQRGGA